MNRLLTLLWVVVAVVEGGLVLARLVFSQDVQTGDRVAWAIGAVLAILSPVVPLWLRRFRLHPATQLAATLMGLSITFWFLAVAVETSNLAAPAFIAGIVAHVLALAALAYGFFYDWMRARTDADDRSVVAESLADMLSMGIPVDEALEQQGLDMRSVLGTRYTFLAEALPRVAETVRRGSSLGAAIESERAFPIHWKRLLSASESTGRLPQALRSLAAIEREESLLPQDFSIRSLLVFFAILSIGQFLHLYIMPTFYSLMENMGRNGAAIHLQYEMTGMQLGTAFLAVSAFLCMFRPVRQRLFPWVSRIPGIWGLTCLQQQAVATGSMAAALRAGLSVPDALSMASATCTHPIYQRALAQTAAVIGDDLHSALARHPSLFARPLLWLADQGQRFGSLPEALEAGSRFLLDETQRRRQAASRILQVGLTMTLAAMVVFYGATVEWTLLSIHSNILSGAFLP